MAKLKAPLMSLGASGQIGKALVYFGWKGLNVVREHVVPSNPKTTGQTTQRGYMTDAVDFIHANQGEASHPLDAEDTIALALLGSTRATPRTWFNEMVKLIIDNLVAGYSHGMFRDCHATPGASQMTLEFFYDFVNNPSTANIWYGTSKTALVHSAAGTIAGGKVAKVITGLTTGTKYFFKCVITAPASAVGITSGIYYGVPT